MTLNLDEKDLEKIVMVGDKVLIKPKNPNLQTSSGLYLPPAAVEKENIQAGYVIKVGPGFPIPVINDEVESWKEKYTILSHSSIVMIIREEGLFE